MNSPQQPNLLAIAAFLLIWGWCLPLKAQFFPDRPDFFEDGYDQLEREIQTLQESSPANSVLTINSGKLQWRKLVDREGNFSVWMPGGEIAQKGREIPTFLGMLNFRGFYAEQSESRFLVYSSQSLRSLSSSDTEILLTQLRDRLVGDRGITPTREAEIALGDYPGRELSWMEDQETMTVRFYQGRDRIYILEVTLQDEINFSSARQTFFDSFELP
ncbi:MULTISPECIES: hypothetical protein [Spirulina sp. CCY15215]|uniref:hypothetical protein n=1 Tax=Spirulina sp. CCY15215 TaxID=2767591 RepID=UPI00194F3814|nr:hypothetical protein [Spirulina major]